MKSLVKQFVIAALVAFIALPAIAAEQQGATPRMPTKGTKSYQSAARPPVKSETSVEQAQTAANTDVSKIAPAAGDQDMEKTKPVKTNSLRDSMHLPRKN